MRWRRIAVIGAVAVAAAASTAVLLGAPDTAVVEVKVPATFTDLAAAGRPAFAKNCAPCHGAVAGGTDKGPPLVHPIYEPNHHADISFTLAVRRGSRSHHWMFGNMPPVPGVTDAKIPAIIAYVRELQRANGIQ